jgi:hypothetical protein
VGSFGLRYGGGVTETIVNPIVLVITILAGVLICVLPRNKAFIPFLVGSILIPIDQIIVLAGLHFSMLRVLILFGMVRLCLIKLSGQGNLFSGGFNKLDKALILLVLTTAAAEILLFQNSGILVYQAGELYNAFGIYFLFRCLIRDQEDVYRVIRTFAFIVVIAGGVMVFEQLTRGWNPYALLGGARFQQYAADMVRDGKIRSMGPFSQPIPAGTFGAVLFPIFCGLWLAEKEYRRIAIIGMLGATAMTLASHSSTPLIAYLGSLVCLCLWPLRKMTRIIRLSIVLVLVSLHVVMKAPVWHLITRFDISGSSYHRYALVDNCIRRFSEWWLIGVPSTAYWGWNMDDVCNQYVSHAVTGGILALVLFILIIAYVFKYSGDARKAAADKNQALFFWALSAAMLANVLAFLGIAYFDQSVVGWYALLAMTGAAAVPQAMKARVSQIETAVPAIFSLPEPVNLRWRHNSPSSAQPTLGALHRRDSQF